MRISCAEGAGLQQQVASRSRARQVGLVLDGQDAARAGAGVLGEAEDPGLAEGAERPAVTVVSIACATSSIRILSR